MLAGRRISESEKHSWKALWAIMSVWQFSGKITVCKFLSWLNISLGIFRSSAGIVTFSRELHSENAEFSMFLTDVGRWTSFKEEQWEKALAPIRSSKGGKEILSIFCCFINVSVEIARIWSGKQTWLPLSIYWDALRFEIIAFCSWGGGAINMWHSCSFSKNYFFMFSCKRAKK